LSSAIEVSQYYIEVAAKYLATNYVLTQRLKIESLNEVRNAFTHVSRAHTVGDGLDDSTSQIEFEKALGHLQRVALDSAKDSIFELRKKCDSAIQILEGGNFLLPRKTHSELVRLLQVRASLSQEENIGPPTRVLVEKYGELLGEYYDFYNRMDDEFQIDVVTRRKRKRLIVIGLGFVLSFVLGVMSDYIANLLPYPW
jgi:hypothetical protein